MAGDQASLRELEVKAEEAGSARGSERIPGPSGLPTFLLTPANEELCRRIRRQYRQLMDRVQQGRDAIVSAGGEALSETLEEADTLFDHVSRPREAALDAQFLVLASDLGCEKARKLNSEQNLFNLAAFRELLLASAGPSWLEVACERRQRGDGVGPAFWVAVQRRAVVWVARAETFHFLLGSLRTEPRARQPRLRRARTAEGGPAMPTELLHPDPGEPTERQVEHILGLLQAYFRQCPGTPVSYFEFVVDPHSFAHTVENMFHVSFIIRDGFARMGLDHDGLPVLEPVDPSQMGEHKLNTYCRKQGVITLTLQDWEDIVATFEISQAMITRSH